MRKRLLLYAQSLATCSCYRRIFGRDFELVTAQSESELLKKGKLVSADVAVLCFCSAEEGDVGELIRLEATTGPLPVLACTKSYNPNFVRLAAQKGVDHFLLCDMRVNRIRDLIFAAIRARGLRGFLDFCFPGSLAFSPYAGRMIDEIMNAFPRRLKTSDLSKQLGISSRRVQMICQEAFGKSPTHLMRRIWVYHALNLMKRTNLDNTEIALQMGYSDGSSLARIFRKELGYSPNEARKRLATVNSSAQGLLGVSTE
jgi:AraC-like DNA-binding protein